MRRLLLLAALATAGTATPTALAAGPVVYVQNDSARVSQAQIDAALPAFQTAVSRDLAPVWGVDATLTTDPAQQASAAMTVTVEDGSFCLTCLGYHWLLNNRPVAYVDAEASETASQDWRLVFTHELFEMLVDPWANRFTPWRGRQYLVEVGDPVESGLYAYFIDGVPISDFVTPAWYGPVRGKPVDFTHALKRPGQIGVHGYTSWLAWDGWHHAYG